MITMWYWFIAQSFLWHDFYAGSAGCMKHWPVVGACCSRHGEPTDETRVCVVFLAALRSVNSFCSSSGALGCRSSQYLGFNYPPSCVFLSLSLSFSSFCFFLWLELYKCTSLSLPTVCRYYFFFLFFSTDLINISPRLLVLPLSRCRVITWLAC